MKKIKWLFILIMVILGTTSVYAKDTVYSINKYQDEKLTTIKDSYNENGKVDGLITVGRIIKEEDSEEYQTILVKYKKNGTISWIYTLDKTKEDMVSCLEYTYDENNQIDGYLVSTEKTEEDASQTTFLKISLKGELVWKKASSTNKDEKISKIIGTHKEDNMPDGYIAIGKTIDSKAMIFRYDRELNLLWTQVREEIEYIDITNIQEDNNVVGYAIIQTIQTEDNKIQKLVRYNKEGLEEITLLEDLSNHTNNKLLSIKDGFILYGLTQEVKLKKGDKSYDLIKYNSNNEQVWETIGDIAVTGEKNMVLQPIKEEYFLLYRNATDSSYEVVKLDKEGLLKEKIKKIKNDYYDIENFYTKDDILYFIGQINCPEDDNCEYNQNSLFLVSNEDKVIEVKDNTSRNIIIGFIVIVVIIVLVVLFKQKKEREELS